MQDAIITYLASHSASGWSPKTITSYRSVLNAAQRWLARRGHRRWPTVSASDLDTYLRHLQARGIKRSSRDHHAWALRSFGAWMLQRGLVLTDPAAHLAMANGDEEQLPPAPLSEEQIAAIFTVLPRQTVVHLRNWLNVELLYSCALRNAEAIALDVADLDFDKRTVLVREGKNRRSRVVPMMGGLYAAAQDYLAVRRELISGPDHGELLLGELGRRLNPQNPGRLLAAVGREVGVHVYPHLLRHSIAVHLLRRGTDIRMIQEFLGHADLNTTKVYLRLVPGQLRTDYDKAMPALPVEPSPPAP